MDAIGFWEYLGATAIAAFAASLAAIALGWIVERKRSRRDLKFAVLQAFGRQVERLAQYGTDSAAHAVVAVANQQTNKGQHRPPKPPARLLVIELRSLQVRAPKRDRSVLDEVMALVALSETVDPPAGLTPAPWHTEVAALGEIVERVALWKIGSGRLPPPPTA